MFRNGGLAYFTAQIKLYRWRRIQKAQEFKRKNKTTLNCLLYHDRKKMYEVTPSRDKADKETLNADSFAISAFFFAFLGVKRPFLTLFCRFSVFLWKKLAY